MNCICDQASCPNFQSLSTGAKYDSNGFITTRNAISVRYMAKGSSPRLDRSPKQIRPFKSHISQKQEARLSFNIRLQGSACSPRNTRERTI